MKRSSVRDTSWRRTTTNLGFSESLHDYGSIGKNFNIVPLHVFSWNPKNHEFPGVCSRNVGCEHPLKHNFTMLKHPKRVSRPLFKCLNCFSYEKSGKVRKNFPTQKFGGGDLGKRLQPDIQGWLSRCYLMGIRFLRSLKKKAFEYVATSGHPRPKPSNPTPT